jgi:hypothetical protein
MLVEVIENMTNYSFGVKTMIRKGENRGLKKHKNEIRQKFLDCSISWVRVRVEVRVGMRVRVQGSEITFFNNSNYNHIMLWPNHHIRHYEHTHHNPHWSPV